MMFIVWTRKDGVIYNGGSWPMARAALDSIVLADDACPIMVAVPEMEEEKEP